MYLINEVSRRVNLSQKRIREYEKEGFINPDREPKTNNRRYSDFEVSQIQRINQLIHERGFTLACLRNLLQLAPCWKIFDCGDKENCSAYKNPTKHAGNFAIPMGSTARALAKNALYSLAGACRTITF